mgnify:CR=1 FL=1
MLLMLVSLTTYAQYPTVKTIKGQKVVIMTVPQAEQIDAKFGMLEDSIATLHSKLKTKTAEVKVVDTKRAEVNDSLQVLKSNLIVANLSIDSLKRETKRIEKLEFIEKKTRTKLGIGIVGVVITWIVFAITVVKG